MASGWGESSSRGDWYATQDFNFRNLVVRKNEKLPSSWQRSENVKYLKRQYGEDSVIRKTESEVGEAMARQGGFKKVGKKDQ